MSRGTLALLLLEAQGLLYSVRAAVWMSRKPRGQRYAEGQAARGHVFEDYVRHLFRRHGQALLDPQPDLLETDLQVPAVELWSRWIGKP